MKEKIKNFLLKIKKFFNEKHTFRFIELIVIAITITLLTITLCCYDFISKDSCFNETHTEQIEETPQTEISRVDRDINRYGYNYDDSITFGGTEFVTDSPFTNIYFNTALSGEYIHNRIMTMTDLFLYNEDDNVYVYNFGRLINSNNDYYLDIMLMYSVADGMPYSMLLGANNDITYLFYNYPNLFELPNGVDGFGLGFYNGVIGFSSFYYDILDNVDYVENAGFDNNDAFAWLVSRTPFSITSIGASVPQLEYAPSSLVNTIPSNAVTTLPNYLGTKVFDSGSAWVQDPNTFSEYNGFGYQIYYKSNILTSETDMLRFTIDGITYDVEPNIYRYYLSEVYFVIYTLWDDTPIYYISNNILDTPFPFTLDYTTRFNIRDLINWLSVRVDIVETYSDYLHIRFNYDYFMRLTHSGELVWLIDEESESFDALIFSTADKPSIIKNDGFMLNIIPELDPKFSKMGQSQTNNMYSTIVHGGTINQVWSNAYHKGIGVGETNGYTDGYNDGIETGKSLQNPLNPIMDFISDGALVISNVFSFEILPNVSLGSMLLFPLAIALIWFVIKLFMGG